MPPYFSEYLIVIHPETANADSLVEKLNENKLVKLRVMTYAEWLQEDNIPEHNVLCMRGKGGWLYAQSATQKDALREEILELLKK